MKAVTSGNAAMALQFLSPSFVLSKHFVSVGWSCSCQPWSPPLEWTLGRSETMVCLRFYIVFDICVPIALIPVCVQHTFIGSNDEHELVFCNKKGSYKIRPNDIARDLASKKDLYKL